MAEFKNQIFEELKGFKKFELLSILNKVKKETSTPYFLNDNRKINHLNQILHNCKDRDFSFETLKYWTYEELENIKHNQYMQIVNHTPYKIRMIAPFSYCSKSIDLLTKEEMITQLEDIGVKSKEFEKFSKSDLSDIYNKFLTNKCFPIALFDCDSDDEDTSSNHTNDIIDISICDDDDYSDDNNNSDDDDNDNNL